ncbi:MAG: glycosyltransferase family 4 protein [Solirubrobacteraceae bacterium]
MRVQVVDPSAFTPAYDHALCAALARAGASPELITSRFAYGEIPSPDGYRRRELFYARALGSPGSRLRRASKLATHVPDMLRYRRVAAAADVVHFQWLDVPWVDAELLPDRPLVLTAHDLLPREPKLGQVRAQRRSYDRVDAVVVHSDYGRRALIEGLGLAEAKVHVIHHGAFTHVADRTSGSLPTELTDTGEPVVLFFGLLRPYKGIETLLRAWQGIEGAQLWIVGRPMIDLAPLRARATSSVQLVTRYVSEDEVSAVIHRADVVVLPYERTERFDQSGVLASALAAGKAIVLSDIGGFSEVAASGAARLVAPGDPGHLHQALAELVDDAGARARLGAAALEAARGPYSWDRAARETLGLYQRLIRS